MLKSDERSGHFLKPELDAISSPMERTYIPALRFDRLTAFYDPLIRWTLREATFKTRLIRQAHLEEGHRVLDLGCGTGTLTLMIKAAHPEADVVGLDVDPKVLKRAEAKATPGPDHRAGPGLVDRPALSRRHVRPGAVEPLLSSP